MDDRQHAAMIRTLVPKIIEAFMKQRAVTYEVAMESLYTSKFYKAFEVQDTGLWRLSPLALCECLMEEIETGSIVWTEEQA